MYAGGYDLGMLEVSEIAGLVEEQADRDCILIFGAAVDEAMEDEIAITVIATGFARGPRISGKNILEPAAGSRETKGEATTGLTEEPKPVDRRRSLRAGRGHSTATESDAAGHPKESGRGRGNIQVRDPGSFLK